MKTIILLPLMLLCLVTIPACSVEEASLRRLENYYGTKLKRKRKSQKSITCEICKKRPATMESIHMYTRNKVNACKECKEPKKNDRVLIKRNDSMFTTVGEICKITENGFFNLEIISPQTIYTLDISLKRNGRLNLEIFQKHHVSILWRHVAPKEIIQVEVDKMKEEEICSICLNFKFYEKSCLRCDKIICYKCASQFSGCPYCRLFRNGDPVKIKIQDLGETEKNYIGRYLEDLLLVNPEDGLIYIVGRIRSPEFVKWNVKNSNKTYYEVKFAEIIFWAEYHDTPSLYGDTRTDMLFLENVVNKFTREEYESFESYLLWTSFRNHQNNQSLFPLENGLPTIPFETQDLVMTQNATPFSQNFMY